jgi:hypothetical protein
MVTNKLVLFVDEHLTKALLNRAQQDYRTPPQQALWILRQVLVPEETAEGQTIALDTRRSTRTEA